MVLIIVHASTFNNEAVSSKRLDWDFCHTHVGPKVVLKSVRYLKEKGKKSVEHLLDLVCQLNASKTMQACESI